MRSEEVKLTFEEIMGASLKAVQDTELGTERPLDLKEYVNKAYTEITEEACITIPSLKVPFTVDIDLTKAYVTLPPQFSRLLFISNPHPGASMYNTYFGPWVLNVYPWADERGIKVCDGLEQLMSFYPKLDHRGDIEFVALEDNVLWYQGIPEIPRVLIILYAKKPVKLVEPTDIPVSLPEYLHRDLLVYKTATLLFKDIEDGIEGDKINTIRYEKYYQEGLMKLNHWLVKRRDNRSHSVWDY